MSASEDLTIVNSLFLELKKQIVRDLLALPNNPKINKLNTMCFTLNKSQLEGNFGAEYHNFKGQYEILAELVMNSTTDSLPPLLNDVLDTGKVRKQEGTVKFHPNVLANLFKVIHAETKSQKET
ncbi:hypothetical protein KAT92_05510 [Candidatus Babeliales bacterium]|nr:hypothetical protein [Candidatus Babeliales bacterium]